VLSATALSPEASEDDAASRKARPKLRGLSHSVAFFLMLAAGAVLLSLPTHGPKRLGAEIYIACGALLFGISGCYHFPNWSHRVLAVLRRLDHAGVFLMISGSYTAFWTLMPKDAVSTTPLIVMWGACITGAVTFAAWSHMPRRLRALVYSVTGLSSIPLVLKLPLAVGVTNTIWVAIASAVYVLGSVVYARRWPNPNPKWFGYHEVFHLMVVAAAAIQYAVLLDAHSR